MTDLKYKESLLNIIKDGGSCFRFKNCYTCHYSSKGAAGEHEHCKIAEMDEYKRIDHVTEAMKWMKQYSINEFFKEYNDYKEELMEILL